MKVALGLLLALAIGADFHRQLTIALEHLAIVGGLLAIAAAGPGLFSLQTREHSS
jgi:uncharacterized membrane protein YphA (DoxX/SURF4 family)